MTEEATAYFDRALELDPQHVPALVQGGHANLALGRPARSLALAQRLLARDPQQAQGLYIAGLSFEALRSPDQAVQLLQRAVAREPTNVDFASALRRLSGGASVGR
jgi:tetratricopeptide (TPR) repeat protein